MINYTYSTPVRKSKSGVLFELFRFSWNIQMRGFRLVTFGREGEPVLSIFAFWYSHAAFVTGTFAWVRSVNVVIMGMWLRRVISTGHIGPAPAPTPYREPNISVVKPKIEVVH